MSRIIKETQEYLSVIGHIKCGMKMQKNGKEYPVSLDHFIATGDYANKFEKTFPDKPNIIEIVFLDDYEAYSCNQRYELRKGKNWYAKGDGKTFEVYNEKSGNYDIITTEQEPGIMDRVEKQTGEKFKAKLTLRFAILKIRDILGVWELNTGGEKTSVNGIVSAYDIVKKNSGGRVKGFTFDLRVKKVTSDKYKTKRNYPIVELMPHASTEHLELVRNCIEQGVKLPLMLEPGQIDDLNVENNQEVITDADFTTEPEPVVESVPAQSNVNLEQVESILNNVLCPADMIQTSQEIDKLGLSSEEKAIASRMKNDRLKSLNSN